MAFGVEYLKPLWHSTIPNESDTSTLADSPSRHCDGDARDDRKMKRKIDQTKVLRQCQESNASSGIIRVSATTFQQFHPYARNERAQKRRVPFAELYGIARYFRKLRKIGHRVDRAIIGIVAY